MSSDDIVERLHEEIDSVKPDVQVLRDAITEIARLRGLLDQEQQRRRDDLLGQQHRDDEIERLRAAIDALLAEIDTDHIPDETGRTCRTCGAGDGSWPCVHRRALDELQEARRD